MIILPPPLRNAWRFAWSVPMALWKRAWEVAKSLMNEASVTVCQSKVGSCLIQYRKWSTVIENGFVPARPLSDAPRSSPNQIVSPLAFTGPFQILLTAAASAGVRQFAGSPTAPVQTNAVAS